MSARDLEREEDDSARSHPVLLGFQSTSKFGITYSSDTSAPAIFTQPPMHYHYPDDHLLALSSSESEADTTPTHSLPASSQTTPLIPPTLSAPRLSRAFSLPLPSQLGHLQNPHRSGQTASKQAPSAQHAPYPLSNEHLLSEIPSEFRAFSLELADSLQMAIQTLLQVSPPQLLDPAKEQFAACSLSVPTPSISSLLTLMKNLNYMASNVLPLVINNPSPSIYRAQDEFDIGEMLQSVGDTASGIAALAGVDLVLYHGDVGMKHVKVKGDECGLSYALSHIIRQIIAACHSGDTVEIGLHIATYEPLDEKDAIMQSEHPRQPQEPLVLSSFHITHRSHHHQAMGPSAVTASASADLPPNFDNVILARLLHHINATFTTEATVSTTSQANEVHYEMAIILGVSSLNVDSSRVLSVEEEATRQPFPNFELAREPSLDELTAFADTLRGKRVAFHASAGGAFAHRLTSYLTAWGMDISHISTDKSTGPSPHSDKSDVTSYSHTDSGYGSGDMMSPPARAELGTSLLEGNLQDSDLSELEKAPGFIVIDDDIAVLRRRMMQFKAQSQYTMHIPPRKRPSLTHRPKSSPHVRPAAAPSVNIRPEASIAIIYFTSIANYKLVRDLVQSLSDRYPPTSSSVPDVIAVPKPAGPRRFLTALLTAVNRPFVDPLFAPIATSPPSPSTQDLNPQSPFFGRGSRIRETASPPERRGSDRPVRSPRDHPSVPHPHPPSPLAVEIEAEGYFPETVRKLGSSPASGLLIQSPDGQPAGIFFQPKTKVARNQTVVGGKLMERESAEAVRGSSRVSSLEVTGPKLAPFSLATSRGTKDAGGTTATSPPTDIYNFQIQHQDQSTANKTSDQSVKQEPPARQTTGGILSPRRQKTAQDAHLETKISPKRGKTGDNALVPPINVLIVEDNPINQTILVTFMKKKRIKYDTAKNGQEAVDKYKDGKFHLILMDIQMPVKDGIEATKEIRQLEMDANTTPTRTSNVAPRKSVPSEARAAGVSMFGSSAIILALTASSLESDRVNALAAGCNDFLTKPVSLVWLNNKIIEWGSLKALQMWATVEPRFATDTSNQKLSEKLSQTLGGRQESSTEFSGNGADVTKDSPLRSSFDTAIEKQTTPIRRLQVESSPSDGFQSSDDSDDILKSSKSRTVPVP